MKILKILFLAISLIGFLDATYLTIKHYQGESPVCAIFNGCDVVTTSQYAVILGIPIALLGALFYLTIFITMIIHLDTRGEIFLKIATGLPIAGFLFSLWLIYLQLFVIKALCLYCIVSATSSTLLFLIGLVMLKGIGKKVAEHSMP